MARLITSGAELQTTAAGSEDVGYSCINDAVIDTTHQRSGAACWNLWDTSGVEFARTLTTGVDHYLRAYFNLPSIADTSIFTFPGLPYIAVLLHANGSLWIRNSAGTTVYTSSTGLISANTYHRIEFHLKISSGSPTTGTAELSVDGTVLYSAIGTFNAGTSAGANILLQAGGGAMTMYADDFALNDSTGTAQNSWCGDGAVVLLKPISDNANDGSYWGTGNGQAQTNLWNAVNHTPPAGQALANATATTQIIMPVGFTIGSTTRPAYKPNLAAYSTTLPSGGGGMSSNCTVTLAQAIAICGQDNPNDNFTMAVTGISNPAIPAGTVVLQGGYTFGAYPTNWYTARTPYVYSPTISLGNSPVLAVAKTGDNSYQGNDASCCFMGLLVEYAGVSTLGPPRLVWQGSFANTVGGGGVPKGALLVGSSILQGYGTGFAPTGFAVADSRGNTYTTLASVLGGASGQSLLLFASVLTHALLYGDAVTVNVSYAGSYGSAYTAAMCCWFTSPQALQLNGSYGAVASAVPNTNYGHWGYPQPTSAPINAGDLVVGTFATAQGGTSYNIWPPSNFDDYTTGALNSSWAGSYPGSSLSYLVAPSPSGVVTFTPYSYYNNSNFPGMAVAVAALNLQIAVPIASTAHAGMML
jgi:hypothetical protein